MSTGTLIWIGIVLFAVIARMAKTGGQARQRPETAQPRPAPPPRPAQAPPPSPRPVRRATPSGPAAPPAATPVPEAPAAAWLDLPSTLSGQAAPRPSVGRMTAGFAGRGSMIRAIVAAEVIGPPKAFVELDNWSHRHREV